MAESLAKVQTNKIETKRNYGKRMCVTPFNVNIYESDYEVLIFRLCSAHMSPTLLICSMREGSVIICGFIIPSATRRAYRKPSCTRIKKQKITFEWHHHHQHRHHI